ncbi:MAG: hybrid sensor histidine kinase/response regulator [Chroococcales cyanobacterium]
MKKILVIEDEEDIRLVLCEMLQAEDFEVFEAANGQTGIELAQKNALDLIICDIMMPHIDGYTVLQEIRKFPTTETLPFIFLTARASKADMRQGMEQGADDYLTKPFTKDELMNAIAARLQKQNIVNKQSQKQLDELRFQITHSLPHELHTPLNGILGISQILIDEYDTISREEALEFLENIYTSGKRLYRLTQNFLLYAELELLSRDYPKIQLLRQSLTSIETKDIIQTVAMKVAEKNKRVSDLILDLNPSKIKASETKFTKLVEEIIDNAFKFSPSQTSVTITSYTQENTFYFVVQDCGRGMNENQLNHLGAYMQFERKLYEQQGSGLGLIIAKRLTDLLDGKFAIESTAGKGTKVQVSFPLG